MSTPNEFERELLRVLAAEEERYRRGEGNFRTTLWSRVSYLMARARGQLRPAPVVGKHNVTDEFRSRFSGAVSRLVAMGYVRRRRIGGSEKTKRFALGYHKHNLRTRDIFLTKDGQTWVETHRPIGAGGAPLELALRSSHDTSGEMLPYRYVLLPKPKPKGKKAKKPPLRYTLAGR